MLFSIIASALLMCGHGVFAAPDRNTLSVNRPSKPLLRYTGPVTPPQLKYAFTAKVDWDLDNNHTIETPVGTQTSFWSREGYWYDTKGRQIGEVLRANDDGIVAPGTNYLELVINYVVKLEDGYWAYATHTGIAILRQTQNGIVRVKTESPKYKWLNWVDFIAPGSFNKTEVKTIHHYFPTSD
ncbi:hypothetical protein C7974DRAFT_411884 [Boeremia exigua]|uniref:uncharacterized protein n=1 Tax=Boeremia exigua TaxID=749465 RepID=UPI001E8CEFD9|nr:uncharacterized protein C7974DRAFT_411884 [Boeremia exigua]KAH6638470.1 hypothetical protein C7974DRAFT_411884 [Boeremia exigua]